MTREEYIASLSEALSGLTEETRVAALAFYTEMLDDRMEDGMDEQSAVASMESPQAIAHQLRSETDGEAQPQPRQTNAFDFSGIVADAMRAAESVLKSADAAMQAADEKIARAAAAANEQVEKARQTVESFQQKAENADEGNTPEMVGDYKKCMLGCSAASLRAVRLQATDLPIRIIPCEGDQATLVYYTSDQAEYRADVQDGVLCLEPTGKPSGKAGFHFTFGLRGFKVLWNQTLPTIELFLPADALVDLTAETTNGSIRAGDFNALCNTSLRTTNGRIVLENTVCKQVWAQTTNGRIVLKALTGKLGIAGKTSNGRIEATGLVSSGNVSLTTSNGTLTAEDVRAGGEATLRTSNGRLSAMNLTAQGPMTLTSSNGGLTVERLSAPALTLRTSNAAIRGSLCGPQSAWSIESGTSNGHNTLPRHQAGEKPLSVHTSNGAIDLTFDA